MYQKDKRLQYKDNGRKPCTCTCLVHEDRMRLIFLN
nr:MAG TPA: hypothetical protein [Caudoviricetes sp.]